MEQQIVIAMHFVCHKSKNLFEEEFGFSSGFWPIKIKHIRPGVLFALHESVTEPSYRQGLLTGEIESRTEDALIKVMVNETQDQTLWPAKPSSNFSNYVYALHDTKADRVAPTLGAGSLRTYEQPYPQRSLKSGYAYVRDRRVRHRVRLRSGGNCEYCGISGFETLDGRKYVECHHIIALSDDGVDRDDNVIALCSEHHRQAHFGKDGAELERALVDIVRRKEQTVFM